MKQVVVSKGRSVVVPVSLGFDVSNDTFTSQIRVDKDPESDLIATWDVSFLTDGTDGELLLRMDDSVTKDITKSNGYMDIKRITGGEPIDVFDSPLEVIFRNTITV